MKKLLIAAFLTLAPLSLMAQKFGHFNSSEIVTLMPEYTTAQQELQTLASQFEDDMKRMQDEFRKKYEEYQKEQANLLDNVRARREAELQDLSDRIQQSAQDNQQAYQKAYQEKMEAISNKITAAVKSIGEAGGYVYIMDVTSGIPYISEKLSVDISPELKKALGI